MVAQVGSWVEKECQVLAIDGSHGSSILGAVRLAIRAFSGLV